MSVFSLAGKRAVITGAGSGIGQAIARLFAQQGAHVHILDFDEAGAQATVAAIEDAGGAASCAKCDVSRQADAAAAIDAFCQGAPLNILVNNAGVAHIGNVLTTEEADFDRIYNVNVKGVYNCLKAGVGHMVKAGGGVVLNMASTASIMGIADRFAYSMSKGAVYTMTLSVAKDFIDQGIRCNCICPARVHTPFVDGYLARTYPGREQEMFEVLSKHQPIGRMGKPEEVAALALFLCSDEAAFITGCAYPMDGGTLNIR